MDIRSRRTLRYAAGALAALMLAAWLVPSFLSAERYRRRLRAELGRTLRRPVQFGALSLHLLPRPGFSLENVVVGEDPAFGAEPFVRVDRIDCDLRWRSLWSSQMDFQQLRLEGASLNVVRNAPGEWNVERLLLESGIVTAWKGAEIAAAPPGALSVTADDARLDFKVGADKKPFAVVGLRARLTFDPARGVLRFNLAGSPVRTDRSLPTPGVVELAGEWSPNKDLEGPLDATLQTRGALLYNWVPLVSGRNPDVYGVLDATVHLTGSRRVIRMDGRARLNQLHRWELLPPSDPMPFVLDFRGAFDRSRGRALVESLNASFADSHLHLSGSVEGIPTAPNLDVVVALERSKLEDFLALGRRFWSDAGSWNAAGRVDGLLTIQGAWAEPQFGGFVGARQVSLNTPSGNYSVSEVALKIDKDGASLAPFTIALAPRVELVVQGGLRRTSSKHLRRQRLATPQYELALTAKSIPLRDAVRLGRALGVSQVAHLDAEGLGTASFQLNGSAWPWTRPAVSGRVELRAARLLIPGLTEPLNVPRASIHVNGGRIVADPVVAVIGTSVFTGKLEHRGAAGHPWEFQFSADSLAIDQGALWFEVLGHRPPLPLLDRLPGLSSGRAHREVARNLFGAISARGRFETPRLTYRSLELQDFRASVVVSGRVVRVEDAKFRAGAARGDGRVVVDLHDAPATLRGEVALVGAQLRQVAARLPAALRGVTGALSGQARFETRGLTRAEMAASLSAEGTVELRNVTLGGFDPLRAVSTHQNWGALGRARGPARFSAAAFKFRALDRQLVVENFPLQIEGGLFKLSGVYSFDGNLDLDVAADFRHLTRPWRVVTRGEAPPARAAKLRLTGPLSALAPAPPAEVSQAER
jgi:hypothetical protein